MAETVDTFFLWVISSKGVAQLEGQAATLDEARRLLGDIMAKKSTLQTGLIGDSAAGPPAGAEVRYQIPGQTAVGL